MEENQMYYKNFAPVPIADLLDGKQHFVMPSMQLGYCWDNL